MPTRRLGLLAAVLALGGGCRDLRDTNPVQSRECAACHGDPGRSTDALLNAAPPRDLNGNTDPSAPGVGAHGVHLGSAGHRAVPCGTCHVVPTAVFSPGHVDGPEVNVVFGGLATVEGHAPAYDRTSGNCAQTYCHGPASVKWTAPRDEAAACGTCHGLPPALPHVQDKNCSRCHGQVIAQDGSFVRPDLHVDGTVEVASKGACSACHGQGDNGGPPPDLSGQSSPSAPGAGSHAVHLTAGATHGAVSCAECHVVPAAVDSPGHVDNDAGRATVTFGTIARTSGNTPAYASGAQTCSGTYCHGSATPAWTNPPSSQAACGTCHGLPPALPHAQDKNCSRCHDQVIAQDGTFLRPDLHVDGTVEVALNGACSACHGQGAKGGPPPDLSGQSSPSAPGAGAHAVHLTAGATHAPVSCAECHIVPATVDSPGHIDNDGGRAEVVFGTLARSSASSPAYASGTQTCSGTYCHGSATPVWTNPPTSAAACGTCHGLPPPPPHSPLTDCSRCHGQVIAKDGTFVRPDLHVNGTPDFAVNCASCHGTAPSGGPPPDLAGSSDPAARGVGAHALHLAAGPTHAAVECAECHLIPASIDSPGHRDNDAGHAVVTFGSLAKSNGAKPIYDASALTCSGTYCHAAATPRWTAPKTPCGTCHGLPPPPPHPPVADCSRCHGAVVDAARSFVRPDRHIDGRVDVAMTCSSCHGSGANGAPPPDLDGGSDVARRGVGAHQAHLTGGASGRPVACAECHVVPSAVDHALDGSTWGPATVKFSGTAVAKGFSPVWDPASGTCTGTYCHGPDDLANRSPVWTAPSTGLGCTSCHGMPPPDPHTSDSTCGLCHTNADASNRIIDRTLHVNGVTDL